jgi:hypothetical protein
VAANLDILVTALYVQTDDLLKSYPEGTMPPGGRPRSRP